MTLTDGSAGSAESRSLAYDGLDRMTTANAPAQLGNESYRFDALDNLRGASPEILTQAGTAFWSKSVRSSDRSRYSYPQ